MKKRNVFAASLAVLLVAVMLLGGTFAYLTGTSEEVENTFEKNNNSVELDETTGEEYEIVPGTSQTKDPVITATYTLDSYVFVEVTDATDGLVTWYIENGWTLLTSSTEDGVTTYIYYQLLEYDEAEADGGVCTTELHVLEGDTVYYSSSITNADMEAAGDDLSLTFQAYIMQAEPFLSGNANEYDGAYAAYYTMLSSSGVTVDYEELEVTALVNGKFYSTLEGDEGAVAAAVAASVASGSTATIDVVVDTEVDGTLLFSIDGYTAGDSGASVTLDLNGNTITYKDGSTAADSYESLIRVVDGVTLTITGEGTIDGTNLSEGCELIYARGGNVVIESGTFILESAAESVVCARKTDNGEGIVEIYGGTFINNGGSYTYGSGNALTLNLVNGNPGTITVYGGTFYGRNPADGDDNLGDTFVAEGYAVKTVSDGDQTAYVVYKEDADVVIEGLSLSAALSTASELQSSVAAITIELSEDDEASSTELSTASGENLTIDLNGYTLTATDSSGTVVVNGDLTIEDGTLEMNNVKDGNAKAYYSMEVYSDSSLTLDGVTITQDSGVGIAKGATDAVLTIKDSTITSTGYYGVGTNASENTSGVVINIENSTITVTDEVDANHDSVGVCLNVDGILNITNSVITAERQGVMVRGGTANITDSTITTTAEYTGGADHLSANWGSGNEVPMAAIVAGNRSSSSYAYATTLTLSNVTLNVENNVDTIPAIYVASCGYNTTITGASDSDTLLAYVGGTVSINGTMIADSITSLTTVSELATE